MKCQDKVTLVSFFLAIVGALAFVVWLQVGVWEECRAFGHSWWYCVRLMAR